MTPTRLYTGTVDADGVEVTLCGGLDRAVIRSVIVCNTSYELTMQFRLRIENPSDPTVEEGRVLFVEVPPISTVIENFEVGLPAGYDLKAMVTCGDTDLVARVIVGGMLP